MPASDYRALQNQVRELHRLLGKKTLEAEILKEALEHATGPDHLQCFDGIAMARPLTNESSRQWMPTKMARLP